MRWLLRLQPGLAVNCSNATLPRQASARARNSESLWRTRSLLNYPFYPQNFTFFIPEVTVEVSERNSLSNFPCPLGRARGSGRYNLLARAINIKFYGIDRLRSAPRSPALRRFPGRSPLPEGTVGTGNCSSCYAEKISVRVNHDSNLNLI